MGSGAALASMSAGRSNKLAQQNQLALQQPGQSSGDNIDMNATIQQSFQNQLCP